MKTLATIIAHINVEKLNESGKKKLNVKLERHLARPHTFPYEVFAFICTRHRPAQCAGKKKTIYYSEKYYFSFKSSNDKAKS